MGERYMAKIVRALDCWLLTWCRELQCEVRKFVTLAEAKAWCVANGIGIVLVME